MTDGLRESAEGDGEVVKPMSLELSEVTYEGPQIDDIELLHRLPQPLKKLLEQVNGFVQFGGGLHVRGACRSPDWHSLREAWQGERAFHRLYPEVSESDIPFAQDCVGDQFLLRGEEVLHLGAEDGSMDALSVGLDGFLGMVQADPVEFLSMQPLIRFQREGNELEPGQLLSVVPPFVVRESKEGVSLRAIPAAEVIVFHAELSRQLGDVPNGGQIIFRKAPK